MFSGVVVCMCGVLCSGDGQQACRPRALENTDRSVSRSAVVRYGAAYRRASGADTSKFMEASRSRNSQPGTFATSCRPVSSAPDRLRKDFAQIPRAVFGRYTIISNGGLRHGTTRLDGYTSGYTLDGQRPGQGRRPWLLHCLLALPCPPCRPLIGTWQSPSGIPDSSGGPSSDLRLTGSHAAAPADGTGPSGTRLRDASDVSVGRQSRLSQPTGPYNTGTCVLPRFAARRR
jgi:hypothetical protein